ncbi:MAG: metallophosphoesterase [Planctomycetota bacterium]
MSFPSPSSVRQPQRRYSRARLAFFRTVEWTARLLGGRRFYEFAFLSKGRFRLREEIVEVEGLPAALEGFTTAHWSDLHAGPFLREGGLRSLIEAVHERKPDLQVLTGDFVVHHADEARHLACDLGELHAPHGCFAVFGNHDYKHRRENEIAELFASNVRFLRNSSVRLELAPGAVLALTGLEDLEEGKVVDLDAARSDLREGDVEICLCHNPSGAAKIAREGCALVLSGHSHGMQIDLPYLRHMGPHHPGSRVRYGSTELIVSNGVGVVGLPLRFRVPAEVVLVKLRRAPEVST